MWGVRKQGRKQKGGRERKQSREGNKKPNKKLPPIPPNPHFFHPPFPPIPPLFHSRESGNLPTPAPTARIPRQRRQKREIPAFAGMENSFFLSQFPSSLLFSFPPFFYYPRIPPHPPHSPPLPFPRKRESPDSSAFGANPRQRRAKKSPPKAGNPPKSPYPLRAEKKYPPRPLIVPPRPRLTKKQHQSAFFCILLRFGRQKMVFYRVMGVPPASEAHLFRHWRNK